MTKQIATVAQAIDYIEAHLTQKLDLDTIAKALHYSKFYLHRSFSETLGLTLHDYKQRRQLTEAAKLLVFSKRSILDIALVSGYSSQQAFTSVFKAMYKQTPSQFREQEVFYPLQLKYELEGKFAMLNADNVDLTSQITPATKEDIPSWLELTRLVVGGFPYLDEAEYVVTLKEHIARQQALILKDGELAVGCLIFSAETGSIDFLGVHPLYRKKDIAKAFLDKVMTGQLAAAEVITTTTYRAGDKADTGQRRELAALGFAEGELLMEFGYPTQQFIIANPREEEATENE